MNFKINLKKIFYINCNLPTNDPHKNKTFDIKRKYFRKFRFHQIRLFTGIIMTKHNAFSFYQFVVMQLNFF